MICQDNRNAEVCIVGRVGFGTGIGALTFAMCELLARSVPVCLLPTEPDWRGRRSVCLPSGREIPVCSDRDRIKVWIFTDVLWNGQYDTNYLLVPEAGLRIAYIVFDSDELPAEWVDILNQRFDLTLVTSPHLVAVAHASGVQIPVATLPLALDIDAILAQPLIEQDNDRVRFLSVSAFHPRKAPETLAKAFMAAFSNRDNVELVLHSNLTFGDTVARLEHLLRVNRATNIRISTQGLPERDKNRLIESCDVFVSCSRGEGYSIGPREALAFGKRLVLSAVGGHLELGDCKGVNLVAAKFRVAARYPEIDNRIFGYQQAVTVDDLAAALHDAAGSIASGEHRRMRDTCRRFAGRYAFSRLAPAYAQLIDETRREVRRSTLSSRAVELPSAFRARVIKSLGRRCEALGHRRHRVVQMHDGGYFSIFNVFFSNLVCNLRDERCGMTLPDWDVRRMIARYGTDRFTSFCYGNPEDGNIWPLLYEPLFGLSAEEMNDHEVLYANSATPDTAWNEHREPLLTGGNAYRLYRWPGFPAWRRQYHTAYRDHIHLRREYAMEIDAFTESKFGDRFMLAVHVRHPSHSIEQPGFAMAQTQSYINRVRTELVRRGIPVQDDNWGVFLATDQERVVEQFREAFGDHLVYFEDVRRTRSAEDEAFEALAADERTYEGYQVQHLVASDPEGWSTRMAWEIIRDAVAIARCRALLHVVSNVSTAVAYMNPDIEMIFAS